MRKLIILLLFPFFCFIQSVMAASSIETVFYDIFEKAPHCIKSYDDEKIYLYSENIHFGENGIFLDLNGFDYIPLPCIVSDGSGCYIPHMNTVIRILNTCPHCGKEYFIKCRNPECPSKNK